MDLLAVLSQVGDKRKAAVEIRRLLGDFPVTKDIVVTTLEEIERRGDSSRWVLLSTVVVYRVPLPVTLVLLAMPGVFVPPGSALPPRSQRAKARD